MVHDQHALVTCRTVVGTLGLEIVAGHAKTLPFFVWGFDVKSPEFWRVSGILEHGRQVAVNNRDKYDVENNKNNDRVNQVESGLEHFGLEVERAHDQREVAEPYE